MIKLCIFDLDGTLLNTIGTISHYGNLALKKNGIDGITEDTYKILVGTGIKNLIKGMLEFKGLYSQELFSKVFEVYDTAYNANTYYKTEIYRGVKETIDEIKARDIKTAVVSNKPDFATQEVVSHFFGENYFDFVTGQKPGAPLKPDPTAVFEAIRTLGVSPEECIYIGDTGTDMKTGKNAGLYTVGVLWGFRGEAELAQNGADEIINRAEELLNILSRVDFKSLS